MSRLLPLSFPIDRFRRDTVGATDAEISVLQAQFDRSEDAEKAAVLAFVDAISDADVKYRLTRWRAGGPFGGALPFAQAAILSGDPADDVFAISYGQGLKIAIPPNPVLLSGDPADDVYAITAGTGQKIRVDSPVAVPLGSIGGPISLDCQGQASATFFDCSFSAAVSLAIIDAIDGGEILFHFDANGSSLSHPPGSYAPGSVAPILSGAEDAILYVCEDCVAGVPQKVLVHGAGMDYGPIN